MDRIYIKDLQLDIIIGVFEAERKRKQRVIINLELGCDLSAAGESDCLEHTVDYFRLEQKIVKLAESSSFQLLEKLASEIADLCLLQNGVAEVKVIVDKPDAMPRPRSVAVEINRTNESG